MPGALAPVATGILILVTLFGALPIYRRVAAEDRGSGKDECLHSERHHGEQEIVSRRVEGDIHRCTYADLASRSRRMAKALQASSPVALSFAAQISQ